MAGWVGARGPPVGADWHGSTGPSMCANQDTARNPRPLAVSLPGTGPPPSLATPHHKPKDAPTAHIPSSDANQKLQQDL